MVGEGHLSLIVMVGEGRPSTRFSFCRPPTGQKNKQNVDGRPSPTMTMGGMEPQFPPEKYGNPRNL
jgi:hypothetical protein